ncbi:DUF1428 domain-containing protein [Croceicoccus gelatinilyticus]|uniref:DUF1428 domain-containing protein n=1 Tax=Croceicoccus gelatinilyticus TaxID=2835536 RepID=UPI001BCF8AB7|nr:DUF1428 domain-containing protein [Croceicoccus gelatinilyticus]MBS7668916.1 DUF1428 domain-containing protein [Croceicoccus gelatinilyticus]
MYIQGFLIPVPAEKESDYLALAKSFDSIFMDHGAIEVVEAWEDDVPDGKVTDFRRAVAAQPGEKVVFSWVIWPDKETAKAAEDSIMAADTPDMSEMPFDGKRLVHGGFRSILELGR